MQEVPFAWWHKCMVLQGRKFSVHAVADVIQCSEWRVDSIHGEDLDFVQYDDATFEKLGRIEAGVSPVQLVEADTLMKWALESSVNSYVQGGSPGATASEANTMSRKGISPSYSLSCATEVSYKNAQDMRDMHAASPKSSDCMMDILEWSFFYIRQSPPLFLPYNYLSSRGARGVDESCYVFDESSRVNLQQDIMERPMKYVQNLLLVKRSSSSSSSPGGATDIRIHKGIRGNDFSSSSSNDAKLGLLLAEFIPEDLDPSEIPDISAKLEEALGPQTSYQLTPEEMATTTKGTCMTLPDVEKRLPKCEEPPEDILLEERHCKSAYAQVTIESSPITTPIDHMRISD